MLNRSNIIFKTDREIAPYKIIIFKDTPTEKNTINIQSILFELDGDIIIPYHLFDEATEEFATVRYGFVFKNEFGAVVDCVYGYIDEDKALYDATKIYEWHNNSRKYNLYSGEDEDEEADENTLNNIFQNQVI